MTDQNDPRNPVDGGNPDQPTEHFDIPQQYQGQQYQGQQQYPYGDPDQNTEYLGQRPSQPNPTQAFPAYNPQFDPQAPPPGATQAYPPYSEQPGNTTQQYSGGQYPSGGSGGVPPEQPVVDNGSAGGGKPRKIGTWIAAGVVGILVAVIAIIGISMFGSSGDSGTQTAFVPPTTTRPAPTTTKPAPSTTAPVPTSSPLDNLPGGIGDVIGKAGGAVGTVVSNDGGTIVIRSIGGSQITILTTPDTSLIAFNRSSIADLQPGDNIVVDGSTLENGTMTAKTILDAALPSFGN